MPEATTHYILGKEILNTLEPNAQTMINKNLLCYYWGLLGPDIFYFHRKKSKDTSLPIFYFPEIGSKFHAVKGEQWLKVCKEYVEKLPEEKKTNILPYISGLLGHYAVDTYCHPYIFARQYEYEIENTKDRGIHNRIESDIATIIYSLKGLGNITHFKFLFTFKFNRDFVNEIGLFYQYAAKELLNVELNPNEIIYCFIDTMKLSQLMYDPLGLSMFVGKTTEFIINKKGIFSGHIKTRKPKYPDILNENNTPWTHPITKEVHKESFLELADKGEKLAKALMENLCLEREIPEELSKEDNFLQTTMAEGKIYR